MYEKFYGFSKKPFSISPDPDFLFLNDYYKEAYALMQYCILDGKGILCITGEVGTGKTMLLNRLLGSLDGKVKPIVIPFPKLTFNELVQFIMTELGINSVSRSITESIRLLSKHLMDESADGRSVVLLIDEAQNLDGPVLENLRLLSNIETPKKKLLQIVLLGQSELDDKLELPELRQFKQRISIRYKLKRLTDKEIPLYIAHRMKVAGSGQGLALFKREALDLIRSYSDGIPRAINSICENALLIGFASGKRTIDENEVHEAAGDLMLRQRTTDKEPEQAKKQKVVRTAKKNTRKTGWPAYVSAVFCFAAVAFAVAEIYLNIFDPIGFVTAINSKVKNIIQGQQRTVPPSETRDLPSPGLSSPLIETPPSEQVEPAKQEKLADILVIKEQENISKIAAAFYGTSHSYVLGLIHMANPKIEYLDLIHTGEKLVLPYLRTESMVFKNGNGSYNIFIAATKEMGLAKRWQNLLTQYGISATIVPVKINQKRSIYRLQGDNFPTLSSAVAKLKDLVPLQLMTKSMEEKNE